MRKVKSQTTGFTLIWGQIPSPPCLPLLYSIRVVVSSLRGPGGGQAWQRLQARVMQWGLGRRPGGWGGGWVGTLNSAEPTAGA